MINVRCDDAVKAEASTILAGVGLTVSDAVRLFVSFVADNGRLPSDLSMDDAQYREFMAKRSEMMFRARKSSRPASEFLQSLVVNNVNNCKCGSEHVSINKQCDGSAYVYCDTCGKETEWHKTEAEATAAWSRRAEG